MVDIAAGVDKIRYRRKYESEWSVGVIDFVWEYAGDDIIDLVGGGSLIPALGDEWELER
jgi:hypothetical protein